MWDCMLVEEVSYTYCYLCNSVKYLEYCYNGLNLLQITDFSSSNFKMWNIGMV